MSRRTVYGHAWSENGWPMVDRGSCEWIDVPGVNVQLEIQKGWPLQILRAFAADFNAYVEPLRNADSACWTPTNSVATSNHLSGTALDLNWEGSGNGFRLYKSAETNFPNGGVVIIRDLLDWYEGLLFWGQDWSIQDGMHFQMNGNTFNNDRCQDFIDRKIRADGFSTFRRDAGAPAPAVGDAADVLARATGLNGHDAAAILPGVRKGLLASDATNPKRIAMWLAQMGHESAGWKATEEYASGRAYEGRSDLGNTHPGDGVRFKGRSWIQITGRHNYGKLSEWAFWNGLVDSPSYFVDNPKALADIEWAGLGPAWYWTVARTDINDLSDVGDLVTVTRRINGGTNGLADRAARYKRATAVGDDLLAILQEEEFMSAEIQKMVREIHGALFNKIASNSIYRDSNDGEWRLHELVKNNDGFAHQDEVEQQALAGNPYELARVVRTARGDGVESSDWAVARAQRVLVTIERDNPEFLQEFLEGGF